MNNIDPYKTKDEVLMAAVILLESDDTTQGSGVDFWKAELKRLCPPGRKLCLAKWPNGIQVVFGFSEKNLLPSGDSLYTAYKEALAAKLIADLHGETYEKAK